MALVELRIGGLAVLQSARMVPGPALTALTGETGSGKSLCITALRLALGARVDGDPVRVGSDLATVAAVFDDVPDAARSRLEAHGIAEDDLLTLSREVSRSGRGACRVNGALVSLATLRAVGEELVEVTAQGESHRLLRPTRQRSLLDAYGGAAVASARADVAAAVLAWHDAEAALERARHGAASAVAELEEARRLVADLQPLGLRVGEEEELGRLRLRLRHAAGLRLVAEAVRAAASGVDDGAPGAADALAGAAAAGPGVRGLDPAVDELLAEASALVERLRDLGGAARHVASAIEVDDERLASVEERLDALDRVRRRHGGIAAALDALAAAEALVEGAAAGRASLAALVGEVDLRRAQAAAAAALLSSLRADAAARLGPLVTERLRGLRLPRARFVVGLMRTPDAAGLPLDGAVVACGPDGVDGVEFGFTASAQGVPLPLDGGVSGGELSRVAMALRSVVAVADDCPTLVLDEVDTGIGGETAARVGEALAAIARQRQVLVVTHRAEIAARAADHVAVTRHEGPDGPFSEVRALAGDDRPAEIARLLSGRLTDAAVTRAVELLAEGGALGAAASARTMAPP